MVFVIVGLLASPLGFGWLDVKLSARFVTVLAEISLIIILFVDAFLINDLELVRK